MLKSRRRREHLAERAARGSTILTNAVVIVGVVVALLSYLSQLSEQPIQAALDYVDRFNSGEVLEARNSVYRTWEGYDFSSIRLPRETLDDLVAKIVGEQTEKGPEKAIRTAIVTIVTFYDGAAACIETRLCESSVLMDQIGSYGRSFHCLYSKFIAVEISRTRLMAFGEGLARIAQRMGGCGA